MLTMQAFHNRLFSTAAVRDLYLECLVRLTRASREQLTALKSDLAWSDWG
jgi:hypothetical protein